MKRYRVTVGLCMNEEISRQWFITLPASTPAEIRRAILRLAGKKYVVEMIQKVSRAP